MAVKTERFSLSIRDQARGKASCLAAVASPDHWAGRPVTPLAYLGRAQLDEATGTGGVAEHWSYAASNALSVDCEAVDRIGGWDEGYLGWGEEDLDFAYRLHRAGVPILFPDASEQYAVHLDHPVPTTRAESLRRNALRFVAKYPEVLAVREPTYRSFGLSLSRAPEAAPAGRP